MLAELARRAVPDFSARWALKKNSKGDSSLRGTGSGGLPRPSSSESVVGGEGSWLGPVVDGFFWLGESGAELVLARKLGIGSAEGAGEWWKVAPANAGIWLGGKDGLWRSLLTLFPLARPGDAAPFLLRPLCECFRCFEFVVCEFCAAKASPAASFCGVLGLSEYTWR
jgi:hypothetical protein